MEEIRHPRLLIVIQVIFGRPLRHLRQFRAGDIEELVASDIGRANHVKVINRLLELEWITGVADREAQPQRGGRPAVYLYTRTDKGRREYDKLVRLLARYGIILQK